MKIICMVPSLTETLLAAGLDVVGRTQFCIHPVEKIKSIPAVGGTKNIDWAKVSALKADVLVLDKEENPKSFADESPIPYVAVHVEDIPTCAKALHDLSKELRAPSLANYGERFLKLKPRVVPIDHYVQWVSEPSFSFISLEYMIWRNPMMAVSRQTFIGSVLSYLGQELPVHEKKYPTLPDSFDAKTAYLFSSEPYPFAKHRDWISSLGVPAALVDGEKFSWFGIRSLQFLETVI